MQDLTSRIPPEDWRHLRWVSFAAGPAGMYVFYRREHINDAEAGDGAKPRRLRFETWQRFLRLLHRDAPPTPL